MLSPITSGILVIYFLFLLIIRPPFILPFFFFNDPATPEIYTLSLHDALPICHGIRPRLHRGGAARAHELSRALHPRRDLSRAAGREGGRAQPLPVGPRAIDLAVDEALDRQSTRLNSSHQIISYAVFCLKKKTH